MVTMREIAEKAGVSRTAVSRVLSGLPNPKVSMTKIKEICALATELGYCRNEVATAIKSGRSKNIIFAGSLHKSHVSFEYIRGASDYLAKHGFSLTVVSLDFEKKLLPAADGLLQKCKGIMADGVFLYNLRNSQLDYIHKKLGSLPHVHAGPIPENSTVVDFGMDITLATEEIVGLLIAKGVKNPCFIAGRGARNRMDLYLKTWKSSLKKYNINFQEKNLLILPFPLEDSGNDLIYDWMKKIVPDGIYVLPQETLAHVAVISDILGIKPILTTRFNFPSIDYGSPAAGGICAPHYEIARSATEALFKHLTEKIPLPQHVYFPPEVIVNDKSYERFYHSRR